VERVELDQGADLGVVAGLGVGRPPHQHHAVAADDQRVGPLVGVGEVGVEQPA
jgi:hypothetical protein